MITILEKKELRKYAQAKRDSFALSGELKNINSIIISKILNSPDFSSANNVALYFPIKNEIDITSILNVKNKNYFFPRCINNNLEFVRYSGYDSIQIGNYNIKEPTGNAINPEILDIIYIPALMANQNNFRLGYGKGYYDRFFSLYNIKATKVIVVAKELVSNDFIQDDFDFRADYIISA